jgi:choline dehydrogenase-like flavoprotein
MCHPYVKVQARSQRVHLDKERIQGVIFERDQINHALQLSSDFCAKEGLVSISIGFKMKDVVDVPLLARRRPSFETQIFYMTEMPARRENRVFLGKGRDYLGQAITRIEFDFANRDMARRCWSAFSKELLASGLGRASVDPGDFGFHNGGGHHIGTTRMGTDPEDSVVDPNCKVHALDNLYVAGSSIYPAGAVANPTFSIVAFALRLGDHVAAIHGGNAA